MKNSKPILLLLIITLLISTTQLYSQIGIWTNINDLPSERGLCGSTVLDNKIYIIGGFPDSDEPAITDVIAYDPIADTFITGIASLPVPLGRVHAETLNGKIYAVGGHSANFGNNMLPSVYEYDPQSNSWTQKEDMQQPRFNHCTAILNDKIAAIAGRTVDYPAEVDNSVEIYNPNINEWTFLPSMNLIRAGHVAEVVNGKLYVLGGTTVNSSASGIEMYDPQTNQWSVKNDTFLRWGLGSVVLDDHIYFFGGGNDQTSLNGIWRYDVTNDTLIDLETPMPESVAYPAYGLLDDGSGNKCIYVLGGTTTAWWLGGSGPHTSSTVLKYCPDLSTSILGEAAVSKLKYSVFPNPSINQIQIHYELVNSTNVNIVVLDQTGHVIESILNEYQNAGIYNLIWNSENIAAGIYYCKIKTKKYIGTKKLIIQH